MVEHQLPKLNTGVRFPSPAPYRDDKIDVVPFFSGFMRVCGLFKPEFSRALHRRYPNPEIRYFSLCGAFRPFFRAKGSAFLRFEDNSSPRNR